MPERAGAGSVTKLVLVPGSLEDARVWRPQVEALSSEGVDVTCVERVAGFDSLAEAARTIVALLPERFALAGHALGARIALEIIRQVPERVDRIALVSASVAPVASYEPAKRQDFIDLAHAAGMKALAERWIPQLVHERRRDAERIAILMAMALRYSPADYEREARMLLARPDQSACLAAISCKALVLAGDADALSTQERNQAIASALPAGATLQFIPECGHVPMLEKPAAVSAALRSWLS